jgi:uncharacterized protein YlbG (UPF0298 family)
VVLPIQATPYLNYAKRRLFGDVPLKAAAYQQEVLCPEETIRLRPSIFLPGQLDRIKGTVPESTINLEISAATSETATPEPTIAYHIRNVILIDGSIYRGRFKYFIAPRSFYKSPSSAPRQFKTVGLASSQLGSKYFAHWLIDDCIQYRLAENYGQPLCLRGALYSDQETYQSHLGQDWTPIERAWIDRLIIYQDYYWRIAQDSMRGTEIRTLRERVRSRLPCKGVRPLVYLRRGKTGSRRMVQDEEDILDVLKGHDFTILDVDSDSLEHLLAKLSNAKIVVSMEGSHVAHCVYTVPDNSGLIILQPSDRFVSFHRGWSESAGVRFGFVVGTLGKNGYHFSSSEILRTVDLMLKCLEVEPAGG